MEKSKLSFGITDTQLSTAGFVKVPNRDQFAHGSFPGLVFVRVKTPADCAANGGAFMMFTDSSALDVYGATKLVLGRDVGHHLAGDSSGYPNAECLPGAAKPFVASGKRIGCYNDANGRNQTVFSAILGADGLKWTKVFAHSNCFVLAVVSRVPCGLAWSAAATIPVALPCTLEQLKTHPRTNVEFASVDGTHVINIGPTDGIKLQLSRWISASNSSPDLVRYSFGKTGGEMWLHVPCDIKKLIAAGASRFVSTQYSGILAAEAALAVDEELAALPDQSLVPLGVKMSMTLPVSAREKFELSFDIPVQDASTFGARPVYSVSAAGNTGPVGWDSASAQTYFESDRAGPSLIDGGFYPYGGVLKPTPVSAGQPNALSSNAVINGTGVTGAFTVNSLPKLNFTAQVNGVTKRVVSSYDLLKQISPLARASGAEIDADLDSYLTAQMAVPVLNVRTTANSESRASDDPDTAAVRAAGSITGDIAYDRLFESRYEPLSRNLTAFASKVDQRVSASV